MRTKEEIAVYKAAWAKRNRAKLNAQNRERYAADPERHRARWKKCADKPEQKARNAKRSKKWKADNPEKVRRTGRESGRRRREKYPELVKAYDVARHHRDPIAKLVKVSRARARAKGLEHTLTVDDLHLPETCPVFGVALKYGPGNGLDPALPTLDRIDNSKGYVKGNVIVVSWRANRLKSDATVAEMRRLVDFYGALG